MFSRKRRAEGMGLRIQEMGLGEEKRKKVRVLRVPKEEQDPV